MTTRLSLIPAKLTPRPVPSREDFLQMCAKICASEKKDPYLGFQAARAILELLAAPSCDKVTPAAER